MKRFQDGTKKDEEGHLKKLKENMFVFMINVINFMGPMSLSACMSNLSIMKQTQPISQKQQYFLLSFRIESIIKLISSSILRKTNSSSNNKLKISPTNRN
eukprot:GHVR01120369.1.p1 GENE.GHVR01120369.1~~GHVR01120369.1.p1  ORF type:complete len:100 (-),score=9.58 GHVR01120369.1:121-420(-)